jgi:hypothetical protein
MRAVCIQPARRSGKMRPSTPATSTAPMAGKTSSSRSSTQGTAESIAFHGDAAFAQPNTYEFLESAGIQYAIRRRPIRFFKGSPIFSNDRLGAHHICVRFGAVQSRGRGGGGVGFLRTSRKAACSRRWPKE